MTPSDVSEMFESCRRAVVSLRALDAREAVARETVHSPGFEAVGHGVGGVSDVVGRTATRLADMGESPWEAEREALSAEVERCVAIVEGVLHGLGADYAILLEFRYLRLAEWKQVREVLQVSKQTAYRMKRTAFEWISAVGLRRAEMGEGLAGD